jgi:hypothetical protein
MVALVKETKGEVFIKAIEENEMTMYKMTQLFDPAGIKRRG